MEIMNFVARLVRLGPAIDHAKRAALAKSGDEVVEEIKRVIGTYEYGWPALADSTMKKKSADTPLLETGELRESYGMVIISNDEVEVGSANPKAIWQEQGTERIPPRPVILGASVAKEKEIHKIVTDAVHVTILATLGL